MELQQTCHQNQQLANDTVFTLFGEPIEQVREFKYLGRLVTDTDDDTNAVFYNLEQAMKTWGQLH